MELADIQRVRLNPGDKLVLTNAQFRTQADMEAIREQIGRFAPGVPFLILPRGAQLTVLGKGESE